MKSIVTAFMVGACLVAFVGCSDRPDEENAIPLPKKEVVNPLETQVNTLQGAKDLQQAAQERIDAGKKELEEMAE